MFTASCLECASLTLELLTDRHQLLVTAMLVTALRKQVVVPLEALVPFFHAFKWYYRSPAASGGISGFILSTIPYALGTN
jgi:hypothetical protein